MKQHWDDQEGALSAIHDFCISYPAKPFLLQLFLPFQGTWPASKINKLKISSKRTKLSASIVKHPISKSLVGGNTIAYLQATTEKLIEMSTILPNPEQKRPDRKG